ncbi:MAG: thiamine pyrophosphate-binding protein [bacterium]|jgi:acetolactate synthase-1/2/3 large subunit|nr:thiamine pyrophosphate-binding protein [bacterium]
MAEASIAAAAAEHLRALGVERLYGVPGEDHMRLLDAAQRAGLRYVLAREETSAALMATVEAQATGRVGAAAVTLAPGIANAMNGIANAWLDRTPLLLFAGQHPADRFPLVVRQGLDSRALVREITKWQVTVTPSVHQVLARAAELASSDPPGPVFVELPDDVAQREALDDLGRWGPREDGAAAAGAVFPPSGAVERLGDLLSRASRPVAIIGGRHLDPAERAAIRAAVEDFRCVALTSPTAKGVLPPDWPWLAGTFLCSNLDEPLLRRADCILAIGLDANDYFNRPWPASAPTVLLERAPLSQCAFPVELHVQGDPATVLTALEGRTGRSEWTPGDVAEHRAAVRKALLGDGPPSGLTQAAAVEHLSGRLPASTLVAVDAGFGKPLTSLLWESRDHPAYFASHGLSTMGFGLPAANALQLVYPDRPVLTLLGDGSLLMRAAEIGVASELGLAPIYVVWLEGRMGQIAVKQERLGLAEVGADFQVPKMEKLADAFGAWGTEVDTLEGLDAAVDRALSGTRPALIGVRYEESERRRLFELLRG